MNNNHIIINQTLHGYSEGHSLLSSSTELPPEVRRTMLTMSDLSGGAIEEGFEEYITGYPLKEISTYAIAKTWYAYEMSRPGCVWTHTLLIKFSDLPSVLYANALLPLFARPDIRDVSRKSYDHLISFSDESFVGYYPFERWEHESVFEKIVYRLYTNNSPLLIRAFPSIESADILLSIWSQQWPRLRRNFSFCSGSISPRLFKGKLMDLQYISPTNRQLKTTGQDATIIDIDNAPSRIDDFLGEPWVELTVRDLTMPTHEFRDFLSFFGSDVSIRKVAFKLLAETFNFFSSPIRSLSIAIDFIAERFPNDKEGQLLKQQLFGSEQRLFNNLIPIFQEEEILQVLATTQYFPCINYNKVRFQERFINYFKNFDFSNLSMLKYVLSKDLNEHGQAAVQALANNLQESSGLEGIWNDPQLSAVMISLNPRLSLNQSFWSNNVQIPYGFLDKLRSVNLQSFEWETILTGMLSAKINFDLDYFEDLDVNVSGVLLDQLQSGTFHTFTTRHLDYLRNHPTDVIRWIYQQQILKNEAITCVAGILDPNSFLIRNTRGEFWIQSYREFYFSQKEEYANVHAFFLSLAFNFKSIGLEEIIRRSFEPVYNALASNKLDYRSWSFLEVHTKPLSIWKDWDKCKKLINAVVDFHLIYGWPITDFVNYLRSSELSDRVLYTFRKRN